MESNEQNGRHSLKLVVIQNYLSPYRIRLFEMLSHDAAIDFTLLVVWSQKPEYPQWKKYLDQITCSVQVLQEGEPGPGSIRRLLANLKVFKPLALLQPDIVVCSGFALSTILVGIRNIFSKTKLVVWMEGNEVSESKRKMRWFRRGIRKVLSYTVDGYIDAGIRSNEYLHRLLGRRAAQVPFRRAYNAIDGKAFARKCEEFRSSGEEFYRFRGNFPDKLLLFAGRLIELKGIRSLIHIYKSILSRGHTNVGLIILGQGELQEFLVKEKSQFGLNNLFLEGFQEQDYHKYFSIADGFILLSDYDCNPLVVIEALYAGLPIICTKEVGNVADFVKEGETGCIVDSSDIKTATRKIVDILFHHNLEDIRRKSREVIQAVTYENSSKAFLEVAELVMHKK